MAFPTIPTVAAGRILFSNDTGTASPATRTFPNLSSLTKNSGDLLIAIITTYQSTATAGAQFSSWGGGFTEISDQGSSTTAGVGVAYKWSDGTETGTFTVSQAGTVTGHASMCLLSIAGAHFSTPPEVGTVANNAAAGADPVSFNPTGWDVEDTLWIAVDMNGMTAIAGAWNKIGAGTLTNYSGQANSNTTDSSVLGQTEIGVAFRQLAAASEDRGAVSTHDTSNARNSAFIIAVRPDGRVSQTPVVGGATLTGGAPTVRQAWFITPAAGGLTITGYAPTVQEAAGVTDYPRTPLTGALDIVGYVPTAFQQWFITPPAASLALTGYSATQGITITPSVGSVSTASVQPTVRQDARVTAPVGSVTIAGAAPTIGLAVIPSAGSVVIAGTAAGLGSLFTPSAAQLAVEGYAPILARSATIQPGTADAALTGYAPSLSLTGGEVVLVLSGNVPAGGTTPTTAQLTPPPGKVVGDFQAGAISDDTNPVPALDLGVDRYTEIEWVIKFADSAELAQYEFRVTDNNVPLTGYSYYPRLTRQSSALELTPDVGSLLLTGYEPTVQSANRVTPIVGSLDITGYAPTTFQRWYITPPAATLAFSGITPAVKTDFRLTPAVGTVTVASVAPVARTDTRITPAAAEAAVIGQAPTVRKDEYLVPGTGALAVIGYTPGLFNPLLITPAVQALALTGYAPSLFQQALVTPGTGSLTIQGLAPSLFKQNFVIPTTGALEISGTTVTQGIVITPATGGLVITGTTPVAPEAIQRAPAVGALGLTGYAPSVLVRTLITPQVGRVVITPVEAIVNTNGRLTATLDNATLAGSGVVPVTGALAVTLDTLTISTPPPYMWDTSQGKAGSNRPVVRLPESYTPQDEQDLKDIMHIITALGAIWR